MVTNTPKTKTFTLPDLSDRFPTPPPNTPIGSPPDGYVITFNASDGYYIPKPTSKLLDLPSSVVPIAFETTYNVGLENIVLVGSHTGTFTVNLPASPIAGTHIFVKDFAGIAATHQIDVVAAVNIDSSTTYTINTTFGVVHVIWTGSIWSILSKF